ncbi:AraC family transcriptional regulator [Tianweitania sp.]|uniref:helix-turn-helix domain-containing protein n=1 Tax=Tianweitania sp. TaxID=2021634 RepID=UPI0028976258|nr:AraC family transcriptional regulator [Tianweitania sp.]
MSYRHSMTWHTEGIRAVAPAKWRCLDGMLGVFWEAEGQAGAKGYYLSPDPRIMIFFNEVGQQIRMSSRDGRFGADSRRMTRAIYVPAGVPLWTEFTASLRFSHLDLHFHRDRLLKFLAPTIGRSAALAASSQPVEIQDVKALEALAALLVDDFTNPVRHPIYAENLIGSIVAGLLHIPGNKAGEQSEGRLTQAQMNKLVARVGACHDQRLSVAEMAATVGLSESWFASVFKQTTGKTPLQWQLGRRVELAQTLLMEGDLTLAGIAAQLGFCDQAHLTKAFRQIAGETPAAWRRTQQGA